MRIYRAPARTIPNLDALYTRYAPISRLPANAENYQNLRMEGLTRLQEHRLELQQRLDMHRTMEMPPSPSPSSRSLAPFSSASSSLSEGSNQPSGEDSASIVTGIQTYTQTRTNRFIFFDFSRKRGNRSSTIATKDPRDPLS